MIRPCNVTGWSGMDQVPKRTASGVGTPPGRRTRSVHMSTLLVFLAKVTDTPDSTTTSLMLDQIWGKILPWQVARR